MAIACSRGETETKISEPTPAPAAVRLYTVRSDEVLAPYKRTVTVTLARSASRAELEAISREVQSAKPMKVERTFINFDVRDKRAPEPFAHWAVARFEPDLKLQINGVEPN